MLIGLYAKSRALNFKEKNSKSKLLASLKNLEDLNLMINADIVGNLGIGN